MDPYSPCLCGSGKKHKWCCQDIFVEVNQAFEKEQGKQHEAARKQMDALVEKHAGNPQAWCFHAQLLLAHEQPEEAEKSLEKALEISAEHPFALLLKASLRWGEGEVEGALLLARRAAESYDMQALDPLSEVYSIIYSAEMERNNPVAARAALRILIRCQPSREEYRQEMAALFDQGSRYPKCASKEYTLISPPANTAEDRRNQWNEVLKKAGTPRFGALANAFEELTSQDSKDIAAWHNLGILRAWLGQNQKAINALKNYIDLETDEAKAAEAVALCQVLMLDRDHAEESDYEAYYSTFEIREPEPVGKWLEEMVKSHRMMPFSQGEQQGMITGLMLEPNESRIVTATQSEATDAKVIGHITIVGGVLALSAFEEEKLEAVKGELREKVALAVNEAKSGKAPRAFNDVAIEGLLFPIGVNSQEEAEKRMSASLQQFYEETWIHRPQKTLKGNAPVYAAGHDQLRKQLRGVLLFIEQCAENGLAGTYDFDRLRRKLGLIEGAETPPAETETSTETAESTETTKLDIEAMGAPELSQLSIAELTHEQLHTAYQTAQRLQATELQQHFGKAIIEQPVNADHLDRYPIFNALITHALENSNNDEALDLVNQGESYDCEHNEGKRRNDYELRRGQVHVRRREANEAEDVFQRLIERDPDNIKSHVSATEAMLSLSEGAKALKFAEAGLKEARKQKDRDSEEHLMELEEAAKRK